MASENKKQKAKNSHLHNGADKQDGKLKRSMYFTKRMRREQSLQCPCSSQTIRR